MWRHLAANALTFLTVVLFLGAGAIAWGVREYSAEGPLATAMCAKVDPGSTFGALSRQLEDNGAISSPAIFDMGVDYAEAAPRLKAGSHLIPAGASMEEIIDIVTRGGASTCGTQVVYSVGIGRTLARVRTLDPATNRFVEVTRFDVFGEEPAPAEYLQVREESDTQYAVQVIEGTTVWQVVTALNALDVMGEDLNDLPPEGMLAPDQYDFVPGEDVADMVDDMVERQVARLSNAWAARTGGLPLASADEALILASIIEKETGVPEERADVASVFVNRLNQQMKLQTDPTVIYGVTEGQGLLGRGLRQSELRRETPWNTYVIPGLPPTPIANPSLASIEAALNPAETPYIFFVADGTGGHAFAVTLEDHNRNVARWREIEAERAADN